MKPDPISQIDRTVHEKGRLAILAVLAATDELSFTDLKAAVSMTDGNLNSHLRTLQEAGFLAVTKSFQDRRPLTTCSLTRQGREAFDQHIRLLEEIVRRHRSR